jgi:hypothetical protein
MRSCVGVVKSLVHARHGTREARTHLAAGVCLRGDPQAWPEMGNASSRAEDLADADIDDANNVRRASSSFEGYVRGDGSSLSPPTSPLRPHSPRMFVPQVRSLVITPRLLEFELLASFGCSPLARCTCAWSIAWDLHRALVRHGVFLVFCCTLV